MGGVEGGVAGGVIGGMGSEPAPPPPPPAPAAPVLFNPVVMTPPELLDASEPEYTLEAIRAHVQGLMVVRCVITIEGRVESCRVVKTLPHMERAVLTALEARRYRPVLRDGRPIAVDYVFNVRLVLR